MINTSSISVMVFAAGLGTRMGDLTRHQPKPVVQVNGCALLDYALDIVEAFGPKACVINTHYFADQIHALVADRAVIPVYEPELLETGGGVVNAMPHLGGSPIATMNSDAIWRGGNPLDHVAAHWDDDQMDALVLCLPKEKAIGYQGAGDFDIDPQGVVSRSGPFVYTGVQIIKTAPILEVGERKFSLNTVWDRLIPAGRVKAVVYDGSWVDVGTPAGITLGEALLTGGEYD